MLENMFFPPCYFYTKRSSILVMACLYSTTLVQYAAWRWELLLPRLKKLMYTRQRTRPTQTHLVQATLTSTLTAAVRKLMTLQSSMPRHSLADKITSPMSQHSLPTTTLKTAASGKCGQVIWREYRQIGKCIVVAAGAQVAAAVNTAACNQTVN